MMTRLVAVCMGFCVFALGAVWQSESAEAQARVEVGVLRCEASGSVGFIVGSTRDLSCTFSAADGGKEAYSGRVTKIGLDIGYTSRATIIWVVFAPTAEIPPGALAGGYAGVSAEATAGVGLGANAMIGGFEKSIALQPFSVQGQEGLNVAAGISALRLTAE